MNSSYWTPRRVLYHLRGALSLHTENDPIIEIPSEDLILDNVGLQIKDLELIVKYTYWKNLKRVSFLNNDLPDEAFSLFKQFLNKHPNITVFMVPPKFEEMAEIEHAKVRAIKNKTINRTASVNNNDIKNTMKEIREEYKKSKE